MVEEFYEIEDESRFHIKLKYVSNIEDVIGEFFTRDEVKEIVGEDGDGYIPTHFPIVKNSLVKDYLNGLIETAKETQKKTIIIDDKDFVDFLKKYEYPVSQFIPGLRRIGNRLFVNYSKKEKTVPNKNDISSFIKVGVDTINSHRKVKLEIKYVYHDYEYAVGIIKKLTTLEEMKEWVNSFSEGVLNTFTGEGVYSDSLLDSLPFFDMIWEDVSKYVVKEGKRC